MTKIICNKENIREINDLLKKELPEFYEMAKELHRHGMINGLRGVSIELIDPKNPQQQDQQQQEQTECRQCRYFLKDLIGDGTGIGKCAKNAWKTVLWPNTATCQDYEARS